MGFETAGAWKRPLTGSAHGEIKVVPVQRAVAEAASLWVNDTERRYSDVARSKT